MASLASPAVAAAETGEGGSWWSRLFAHISDAQPPWAVEAPGAAGARYGLGLDHFSERQESLQITFMEQSIRTRDLPTGAEVGEVERTDPGLLNRKFKFRSELKGVGPAVTLRLPSTLGLYPTLVLQAAAADVSLDFLDRNRPQDSSSLGGRGPLFGAGLDLTRSLCRSCPWFAGASYFFQRLPSLTVDRSPHFALPGFDVLDDEVRLGRDIQEASTRVGYGFPGSRVVSYLGVRHRWNDVKIDDRLQYRDPFQQVETTLASRTQLKSEVTLALAGIEARLGPRLFGRLETSVGGGDRGVLLRMVYLGPPPPPRPDDNANAKVEKRGKEIAEEIAPSLSEIEASFLAGWKSLKVLEGPDGQPAYLSRELEDLLKKTERDIFRVLGRFPELEALRDWVHDEFNTVRVDLGLTAGITVARRAARPGHAAFAILIPRLAFSPPPNRFQLAQTTEKTTNKGKTDAEVADEVNKGRSMGRSGPLTMKLIFRIPSSWIKEAKLEIFPRYHRDSHSPCYAGLSPNGEPTSVYWGKYVFDVKGGQRDRSCKPGDPDTVVICPLDLVLKTCQVLRCGDNECHQEECPR
ncbi:MAG TPA: hypothetical protein VFC23_07410 [Thermoanaerobaculia bacterium]|nr:hypothetical protein [Thermoanaerobaculia bacterium]